MKYHYDVEKIVAQVTAAFAENPIENPTIGEVVYRLADPVQIALVRWAHECRNIGADADSQLTALGTVIGVAMRNYFCQNPADPSGDKQLWLATDYLAGCIARVSQEVSKTAIMVDSGPPTPVGSA